MFVAANPPDPVVVVDGLLGTGAAAPVREPVASVVRWINGQRRPVVAIDVPTGLDADTGAPMGDADDVVVRATRTVTLGAMKPGLVRPEAQKYVGRVTVCDLGLPGSLVERAQG
jgi:NAD(P)H-hydrate epimerase